MALDSDTYLPNDNIRRRNRAGEKAMADPHQKKGNGDNRLMDQATDNKIVSFIWGIADDVLRAEAAIDAIEDDANLVDDTDNEAGRIEI